MFRPCFLLQKIPLECKLESTDAFRLKQAGSRPPVARAVACMHGAI